MVVFLSLLLKLEEFSKIFTARKVGSYIVVLALLKNMVILLNAMFENKIVCLSDYISD